MKFFIIFLIILLTGNLLAKDEKGKCISGNCKNGKGTFQEEDGTKMVGNFLNGELNGQSEVFYLNGDKFIGNYTKGKKNGKGKYIRSNGTIEYEGDWVNGGICLSGNCKEGKGKIKFLTTDGFCEMDGNFKDSSLTGKVSFICESSEGKEEFIGDYKNGKPNGYATHIFSDKSKYEGYYKDFEFHGQGTFYYSDGSYYKGNWVDGKENGNAVYVWKVNEVECKFEGTYKDGKKHGKGKYTCSDGESFVGSYLKGLIEGKGKLVYSNKYIYEGDFKEGNPDGKGTLKDSEGKIIYSGAYRKGYKYFLVSSPDFINRSLKKPEKWLGGFLNKFIVTNIKYLDELKPDYTKCPDDDCESAFNGVDVEKIYIKGLVKTTECCNLNIILVVDKVHEKTFDKLIENPVAFIEVSGRVIAVDTGYEGEKSDIIVKIEEVVNVPKK